MKTQQQKKLTDYDMQQIIGQVLRYGVLISGLIAITGGIWYLVQQGAAKADYTTFSGEPAGYTSLEGILKGIAGGSAKEIIQLGVVVLIATPIIRIVFSLVSFVLEKDRMYVGITLVVLLIILSSMFGGLKI